MVMKKVVSSNGRSRRGIAKASKPTLKQRAQLKMSASSMPDVRQFSKTNGSKGRQPHSQSTNDLVHFDPDSVDFSGLLGSEFDGDEKLVPSIPSYTVQMVLTFPNLLERMVVTKASPDDIEHQAWISTPRGDFLLRANVKSVGGSRSTIFALKESDPHFEGAPRTVAYLNCNSNGIAEATLASGFSFSSLDGLGVLTDMVAPTLSLRAVVSSDEPRPGVRTSVFSGRMFRAFKGDSMARLFRMVHFQPMQNPVYAQVPEVAELAAQYIQAQPMTWICDHYLPCLNGAISSPETTPPSPSFGEMTAFIKNIMANRNDTVGSFFGYLDQIYRASRSNPRTQDPEWETQFNRFCLMTESVVRLMVNSVCDSEMRHKLSLYLVTDEVPELQRQPIQLMAFATTCVDAHRYYVRELDSISNFVMPTHWQNLGGAPTTLISAISKFADTILLSWDAIAQTPNIMLLFQPS